MICILAAAFFRPKPRAAADDGNNPVDEIRLRNTVQFLSSIKPPRSYRNLDSLAGVVGYIEKQLRSYGLEPQQQIFEAEGKRYSNVTAGIALHRHERIVIGAHYDVCEELPGADDNASGVAAALELARLVKSAEPTLRYGVEVVFYALEEPPFFSTENMGSFHHAKALHEAHIKVKGMICLEMLGYYSDQPNSQKYPAGPVAEPQSRTGNFIAVVGIPSYASLVEIIKDRVTLANIPVVPIIGPASVIGVDFSDHRNYWRFGYPAVMVTDTAFYRNPHYHQESDTIETLDFERMKKVISGIAGAVIKML